MTRLFIVFGSHLFPVERLATYRDCVFYMAESRELCTYYKFHTHKIILFLGAMRQYSRELERAGSTVIYRTLPPADRDAPYEVALEDALKEMNATEIIHWEIEDRFMEERMAAFATKQKLHRTILSSPMFLTSREEFHSYLTSVKKPFMKTFYERQRKRLGILTIDNKPVGGQWSFDEDNRQKLPKEVYIQPLPLILHDDSVQDIITLVKKEFPTHPGDPEDFWLPTNRAQAKAWFEDFLVHRFPEFGPYEDAISLQYETINHSILTPALNLGLLTPDEIVADTLGFAKANDIPLQSVEGFIRQIIGWREFVRGIYHEFPHQGEQNFWKHHRTLANTWYTGETGLLPLDLVIKRVKRRGYAHHIERLMICSNVMLLSEIHPKEAHRWFMELFVDSSDWVMGPNVYGMGLMSDGGVFATKPYICGSSYLLKMSDLPKGFWCDIQDGLYWRFIEKHRAYFASNPRLAVMPKALDKLDPERKKRIMVAAEAFLRKNTRVQ